MGPIGCVLAVVLSSAVCGMAWPAEAYRADWFPFVIPDLASADTAGTPIDLSFLSPEPAGTGGFLRAEGEQVVDGRGVAVRLFGSNICDYHAMPPKDVAPAVAKRLRQLGINFIRLHYFDWDVAPRGILNEDRQTLNAEKLDQLDFLVSELKQCGVYVDLNLHVARGYPDMPEGWDRMGKGLDIIHQPYVDSQKRYARDLLTHVNPYTGNAYANEPAVAVIELNNENTALNGWAAYAALPKRFSGPLTARWNEWLRDAYGSTEGLEDAWNANAPHGPELLRNADFAAGMSEWQVQSSAGARSEVGLRTDREGRAVLRWEALQTGTQGWHLQVFQPSVPVQHGTEYVLSFQARSEPPMTLQLSLMHQQEPWSTVGQAVSLAVGEEWEQFAVAWTAANPTAAPTRLNLARGTSEGVLEVAELSLREGGMMGLGEAERIERGNVPLVSDSASRPRTADYLQFLADLELDYVAQMRDLIKAELGAKSMLMNTQVSYGGLAGFVREAGTADIVDCHAYPAHPRRETDERGGYWSIRNVSMVGEAFGGLESLAARRVAGKPYMVSEFDLNPPNDHAAETFPMLALMAAYQGWSAVADYSWYNFQREYGHSRISSHFADTGHAGQMAFVPAAALLFRLGLVQPAQTRAILDVPRDQVPEALIRSAWRSTPELWHESGADSSTAWRVAMACRPASGSATTSHGLPSAGDGPIVSDTGQLVFDRTVAGGEYLKVAAPAVRMLIGRVGDKEFQLGDVVLRVQAGTPSGYANVALVALDGQPVSLSRKLLLTAVARVENRGQRWNEDRTSIGHDWGEGPTLAEPVRLTLMLPGEGWQASALDGTGRVKGPIPMVGSAMVTGPQYETVWYLLRR